MEELLAAGVEEAQATDDAGDARLLESTRDEPVCPELAAADTGPEVPEWDAGVSEKAEPDSMEVPLLPADEPTSKDVAPPTDDEGVELERDVAEVEGFTPENPEVPPPENVVLPAAEDALALPDTGPPPEDDVVLSDVVPAVVQLPKKTQG